MTRTRGNGEGSIYPVRDNKGRVTGYRGCYWVHTTSGPKRRYLSGKRREDVAEKLAKALANRADGLVFDAGTLTVGEYLDRWLKDVRDTVRQSTY
jgi:integrase